MNASERQINSELKAGMLWMQIAQALFLFNSLDG